MFQNEMWGLDIFSIGGKLNSAHDITYDRLRDLVSMVAK